MTTRALILLATLALAAGCPSEKPPAAAVDETPVQAAEPLGILDSGLGLSRTSVFDTPDPIQAAYKGGSPGSNGTSEPYFSGAPPTIPHDIASFLPITGASNICVSCHLQPAAAGTDVAAGRPTPVPKSHLTDLRNDPGTVTDGLVGGRYFCTQCHVPQADTPVLVDNELGG